MEKPQHPVDPIIGHIATAITEWQNALSEEKIKKNVHKALNQSTDNLMLQLLGLESHTHSDGRRTWRVDHCNGRAGESAAGDILRKWQQDAIVDFFRDVGMPVLSELEKEDLKQEIKRRYMENMKSAIYSEVRAAASRDLSKLIQSISQETQLEDYKKVLSLLGTNPILSKEEK